MSKIFSTEDGNLNSSIRVVKERVYSDIDLSLDARTSTDGDVFRKTDAASVKQAVKNLLLTNRYEKPYRPQYGANLYGLLFELMDDDIGDEIIDRVTSTIERYEPRAKVLGVKVTATPDFNAVTVTIEFRIISTNVVETLKVSLNPTFESAAAEDIPTLPLATTDVIVYQDIIRTETKPEGQRLATFKGDLIRRDLLIPPDDALLTDPDEDMIQSLFNGLFEGVLLVDVNEPQGLLTEPDEDQLFLQSGTDFLAA